MNKPTIIEEQAAQLAANPKLMRAYRCIREAHENIADYMDCEYRRYGKRNGELIWKIFNELDGVLPSFWPNLAELIVADINANINEKDER